MSPKAEVRIELTMSVLQTNAFNHLATQPYYNNLEIVDSANGNRTRIVRLKDG
jgi:hypothetical protein